MESRQTNLKTVLEHFEIPNKALAKALNIDPAQISRWITGNRPLKVSSGVMEPLADYILSRTLTQKDITWLTKAFKQDGFDTEFETVPQLRRALILFLATDGEEYKRNFLSAHSCSLSELISEADYGEYPYSIGPAGRIYQNDYSVKVGTMDIALRLERIFSTLQPGSSIDICLSSETIATLLDDAIAHALIAAAGSGVFIRCLISVSGSSFLLSRILGAYLQPIVKAGMEVRVAHGVMQPVIGQISVIVPEVCVGIITELPESCAPVASLFITEETYLRDAAINFERAFLYAQPIVTSLGDNCGKTVFELFLREFAEPGDLNLIVNGVNPMHLPTEAYQAILQAREYKGEALLRRVSDFKRLKSGMDETLQNGAVFREILPRTVLNRILQERCCRISGTHFFEKGAITLDAGECRAVLDGYIHTLNAFPNFHLLIVDELQEIQEGCWWHMKQNRHAVFHVWKKEKPTLIYSDQLILTHEVQQYFDGLWTHKNYFPGIRQKTFEALQALRDNLAL